MFSQVTADDLSFEREDSPTPAQSSGPAMLLSGEKSALALSPPRSEASVDVLALTSDNEAEVSMDASGSEQSLEIYSSDEEEDEENSEAEEDDSYEESEAESEFSLEESEMSEEDTPVKKSRRRTTASAAKPKARSPTKQTASPAPPSARQPLAELQGSSTPDKTSQRSDVSDIIVKSAAQQAPPSTAKKVKR